MAETNSPDPAVDDSTSTNDDDLRAIKYPEGEVETPKEADETPEGDEEQKEPEEVEEESKDESEEETQFVKKFSNIKGDTPEEYAKNLEEAYENSTAEFHKLRQSVPAPKEEDESEAQPESFDPLQLYAKQQMDKDIADAYAEFIKTYPGVVPGTREYDQFTAEVAVLSQTIYTSQQRLATPGELYTKAAVILGWEPDDKVTDKDRLDNALKGVSASSKTSSSQSKKASRSKVSDAQVATYKAMFPNKSDTQIREELEPYVK